MEKIINISFLLILILLFTGCAGAKVNPNRIGCTHIDGDARVGGVLTNYIKGEAKGVHMYIGKNIPPGVTIKCDPTNQKLEITFGASKE